MYRQRVFIGLGASLAYPHAGDAPLSDQARQTAARQRLKETIAELSTAPRLHQLKASGIYLTRAWGQQRAGHYLNAVVCADTDLPPLRLLDTLMSIEYRLGRRRNGRRWGPRAVDLDILFYAQNEVHLARLQVPHPWLWQRTFVLQPLMDLQAHLPATWRRRVGRALRQMNPGPLAQPKRVTGDQTNG